MTIPKITLNERGVMVREEKKGEMRMLGDFFPTHGDGRKYRKQRDNGNANANPIASKVS